MWFLIDKCVDNLLIFLAKSHSRFNNNVRNFHQLMTKRIKNSKNLSKTAIEMESTIGRVEFHDDDEKSFCVRHLNKIDDNPFIPQF